MTYVMNQFHTTNFKLILAWIFNNQTYEFRPDRRMDDPNCKKASLLKILVTVPVQN